VQHKLNLQYYDIIYIQELSMLKLKVRI